jgi:hypothetical protein
MCLKKRGLGSICVSMTWRATSAGPYRADLSSGQDVAGLKYVCTVTEYKLKRDKSKEKSGGGKEAGAYTRSHFRST